MRVFVRQQVVGATHYFSTGFCQDTLAVNCIDRRVEANVTSSRDHRAFVGELVRGSGLSARGSHEPKKFPWRRMRSADESAERTEMLLLHCIPYVKADTTLNYFITVVAELRARRNDNFDAPTAARVPAGYRVSAGGTTVAGTVIVRAATLTLSPW